VGFLVALWALWILCGILAYGITLGYFYGEFPENLAYDQIVSKRSRLAITMAAAGPSGLLVSYFGSGRVRHGLRFRA